MPENGNLACFGLGLQNENVSGYVKNTVIFPQYGNIVVLIPLHAVISLAVYKHAHSICSCISSAMYTKFICYMHPAMSNTCIL